MKIQRREGLERSPLSFAQHRLWFIDQLRPGHPAYNVGRAIRLRGSLNRSALNDALSAIVARHEILRTVYDAVDGVPMQRIVEPSPVPLPVQDLAASQAVQDERALVGLVDLEIRRPFDLASDRPLRACLLTLNPADHVLVVTVHHIATDTMTIILRELSAFYEAFAVGKEPSLPPLTIQYADYAIWERSLLTGSYLQRLTEYWRRQLEGAPHVLELPTDLPRPRVLGTRATRQYFRMPDVPLPALEALMKSERATPFTAWLAAFGVLLMHYTGQDDMLISAPVACRELSELEPIVGCFANTVVFRLDLTRSPSFREALRRIGQTVWGALAHRRLPFHQVVDLAKPVRTSSRVPLVQANFRLAEPDTLTLHGLDVSFLPVGSSGAKFELAMQLTPTGEGFVDYQAELFSPERISAMTDDLQTLMRALIARPDVPVNHEAFVPPSGIMPARPTRPNLATFARASRPPTRKG